MSDLGLGFYEEAPEKGRHRHRRSASAKQRKKAKKGRGGRSFVALLVVLVLLGAVGYGGWYGVNWLLEEATVAEDYPGEGTGAVNVEVLAGQNLNQIGQTLVDADVVASGQAWQEAVEANPDSANVQPGIYELRQQMRAELALAMLLNLENRVVEQVTIPEGRTSLNTYQLLSEELEIPVKQFKQAAKDPLALGIAESWFSRTDGREVEPSVEGFLFPATYDFPPDPTAEQVLQIMIGQFTTVAEGLDFTNRVEQERNISPYEALIVASLAQAEAGRPEDLGKVARVAYNRVYGDTDELGCHNCLQFDVTVNYWFELTGQPTKSSAEMTTEELYNPENPYNLGVEGLVPSPINNPGQAALEAAMDPPNGDWLYFVAVNDNGRSEFAATFAEHCQNVQKAIQNGLLAEPC
jgi:UPF0755 protein